VIGWAIDEYLHTDLVQAALEMAVAMRGEFAEQVVLHADYAEVCVKPRIGGDGLCRWGCSRIPRLNVSVGWVSQTVEGFEVGLR